MTFTPVIPIGGVLGYRVLSATEANQRELFNQTPQIAREITYFTENIGNVKTADDLVSDRRLMQVALGAFGLDEEVDKRAFIRKMLAEGTENPDAFANRFVDPRYQRLSAAFGFGNAGGARTGDPGFAQSITLQFSQRQFDIAVGESDENMRLALNFRREIQTYATANDPDGTAWFSVMGDQPVRAVFEGAFNLPTSFGQLDIDRQRDDLRAQNNKNFGSTSLAIFADPAQAEAVIERFLILRAAADGPSANAPGSTALTLLSSGSGGFGSGAIANILLSASALR